MATRAAAKDPMKDVRTAWKKTLTAWGRVESSLVSLAEAEAALLRSLRGAGMALTRKARSEINATVKDLDRKRRSATREFEKLAKRHDILHKTPAVAKQGATPTSGP